MISADKILKDYVITEKATDQGSALNKYTFKVHRSAKKASVARAIEHTFNVKVDKVNVINVKPKRKPDRRMRGKVGTKPGYKKAIVTVQKGQTIELL